MSSNAPVTPPTPTPKPAPPALSDLLWQRYMTLLDIKRRIHVIRAFVDELETTTRKKRFQIRNDVVWNMMVDVLHMCVIDLYSWTVEMRHGMKPLDPKLTKTPGDNKRGLFLLIRDHHRLSLTRTYVRHPGDDDHEFGIGAKVRAERFVSMFPGCSVESPSSLDVEELCERFRLKMVPLGKDRNKNRAHAREGDAGKAPKQSVEQLEELFTYCETLLEDLSLVSAGASYGGDNMNHVRCPSTAVSLVDLILFGSADDVARLLKGRTRDALLARLHEIDDARRSEGEPDEAFFNTRQFDPMFEGFPEAMGYS